MLRQTFTSRDFNMDPARHRLTGVYEALNGGPPLLHPTPANRAALQAGFRRLQAFYDRPDIPQPAPVKHPHTSVQLNGPTPPRPQCHDARGGTSSCLYPLPSHIQEPPPPVSSHPRDRPTIQLVRLLMRLSFWRYADECARSWNILVRRDMSAQRLCSARSRMCSNNQLRRLRSRGKPSLACPSTRKRMVSAQ